MKKTLASTLIAMPLLTLSSLAFAAEPEQNQPIQLAAEQMDEVTAGYWRPVRINSFFNYRPTQTVVQANNNSPATILQVGNGNFAIIFNGNFNFGRF